MSFTRIEYRCFDGDHIKITALYGDKIPPRCDNCQQEILLDQIVRSTHPTDCGCDVWLHLDCQPIAHNHPPPTAEEQELLDAIFGRR